ncbi:transposable element Tc1 transposase [Trichonephila clavipes]|nr:transposable element Tc1 transposase [Trichonephila clavipes]
MVFNCCRGEVFSDESRFQLCPGDHRRRLWRRPGQRANPAFTSACHTGPQPGVKIWTAISLYRRILLVVIRDTLTAQRYADEIPRTVLLPFPLLYPGLIFQQDNAKTHTARVAMTCLTAFQTLSWPSK